MKYTPEELLRAVIVAHISDCVECQMLSMKIRYHAIRTMDQA